MPSVSFSSLTRPVRVQFAQNCSEKSRVGCIFGASPSLCAYVARPCMICVIGSLRGQRTTQL